MGGRLGDIALVEQAIEGFTQTGARVYQALALHVRARMALPSEAGAGSKLQRYDRAISALGEVKAEYELGVACKQRAQLHQQLAQLDESRVHLAPGPRPE